MESRPQSCTIDDISFNAIGLHCGSDVLVPVIYFKEGILSCDRVEVYLENTLTHEENEEFLESISRLGKVNFTRSPVDLYAIEKADAQKVFFEITAGFVAIMLVFRYLISYMITENMRENTIYRLVGADTYTISFVMIIDVVITNIFLAIMTCIIHRTLFNILFNNLNYYKQLYLELNDYVLIIGVTSLFSFILLLPKLIKASKMTVIQVRQEV